MIRAGETSLVRQCRQDRLCRKLLCAWGRLQASEFSLKRALPPLNLSLHLDDGLVQAVNKGRKLNKHEVLMRPDATVQGPGQLVLLLAQASPGQRCLNVGIALPPSKAGRTIRALLPAMLLSTQPSSTLAPFSTLSKRLTSAVRSRTKLRR